MALVHPTKPGVVRHKGEMHPAIGLLCGFAILVGVALGVHMLFGLL